MAYEAPPPAYGQLDHHDPPAPEDLDRKDPKAFEAEVPDTYIPGEGGMIKYNMYYTTSRSNVTLHEGLATAPAVYYAESESFTIKPFFFLRKGNSKTSPMVSFVKFKFTSRHMLVGKGDIQHDSERDVVWSALEREKWLIRRSDYRFVTTEGSNGVETEYIWRKDKSKCVATIYDCVDPNGRTVAKMQSGGMFNWKKGGETEVLGSLDEGLREMLLASALGIWTMEAMDYQSVRQGFKSGSSKDKTT